ncbi:MAG: hypothetical protein JSR52_01595 [Planctomycetes bacterium]|nr:hypothetical protein [Planctomycetota bacterium]
MQNTSCLIGFSMLVASAGAATPALAINFNLTPVTVVAPNYIGPIAIMGSVSNVSGHLNSAAVNFAFNSTFTAGINGVGPHFDAGFLAWNGVGTYTGAIYIMQMDATCLGYSGGMPLGHYAYNPGGPGGFSAIRLTFRSSTGVDQTATARYAIDVVPSPGPLATLALAGVSASRRRRRAG